MNKLKFLLVFPFLVYSFLSVAQNDSEVFIDFGDEKVSKAEFKRVYEKNNSGEIISKSTVDEYLDLYINFKLKVKEAEAKEMDKDPAFVKELSGYRKQLAQPYLTAEGILEELKKQAYERLQYDVKASHILITVSEDASPEDTMKAYKRIADIKKNIEKGQDFEAMAKQYSEDPSAKTNGGDLGYFTAFYMVYPFENAAYNTKVGSVSEIIRTQFGYHILKVFDRRPAVGNIKVAHILISSDKELSKTEDPEGKIREIYKKIKKGEDFQQMAAQFSDDTRSSSDGGILPTFGVGRMVPAFEKAAFDLKKDGEISEPFATQYGWHIVKRIEKTPIGDYKSVEREILTRIKKDSRSNLSQGAVVNKIKKQYGFKEYPKEREDFYSFIDSTYFNGKWDVSKTASLNKTLFSIGEKEVNQQEFATYLKQAEQKRNAIDPRVLVQSKYNTFLQNELLEYKDSKLDEEYPDFKALMEEYHDGILLFNLTDKLVWSKAVKDTAGLEAFYNNHKENYKWDKRVDAVVYSALNEKVASQVKEMLKKGVEINKIMEEINQPSQLNLRYEKRKYLKGDDEVVDQVEWKKGTSKNIKLNERVYFVDIKEVIEPNYKTLEDSRGIITSDYQNYLEKEWISNLRAKYSFTVDKKVLKALKAELNQ